MKFFAVAALFTSVLAAPALEDRTNGSYKPCPSGLFSQARCCATDVLGVACLDGDVPHETPRDAKNFQEICAKGGQQPRCCLLDLLGQELLCSKVVGL